MMKKLLSIVALSLFALALTWCSCSKSSEDEALEAAIQKCLDLGWTHSLIHSQTAAYGECSFPSGVICEDQSLDECDYSPNLENIETPEKRLASCQESVDSWVQNIENGELVNIDWSDESEAWASFARSGIVTYTKDWSEQTISCECVSDFVDWSTSVSYGQTVSDEESVEEIDIDLEWDEYLGEFPEGEFPEEDFPEWEFPEEEFPAGEFPEE